jgi:hypothetical protein
VVDKVGGFRPYFITAEDIDYQLRLAEVTRVMYLPGSCYLYRLHEDSITHKQNQSERIFFEDMAREFLKQRVDSGFDDLERKHPPASPGTGFDSPGKASDQIAGLLMGRAWLEHEKGRKSDAIRYGVRALREKPGDLNQWKSFIALIVK